MHSRSSLVAVALACGLALFAAGAARAESPNINTPATITGTAAVGQQLTAHNGTWLYTDGTSCHEECVMTYQWQRYSADGVSTDIAGAVGRFYTVSSADAGSRLRAMETMTKYDCNALNVDCRYVSRSAPSGMSAVVPGTPPGPTPAPPAPPATPKPQAVLAPAPTSAPTVSGTAMVDELLTATRGRWSGSQPLTIALQWQRCDEYGDDCQDLGLSGDTYTVIPYDIGYTLRVRISASNAAGSRSAVSDETAVVSELLPTEQKPSLLAAKVLAPHKLVIDQATSTPARLTRLGSVRLTVRVSDDRGFRIEGALVTAVVRPGTALAKAAEVATDENGFATLAFAPGVKLKTRGTITLVVTARRPGDRFVSPRAAVLRLKVPVGPR